MDYYDEVTDGAAEQIDRERHAENARLRREARAAFDQAAKSMRRKVRAVAQFCPIPEHIDRATRILDASCVFLSRGELLALAQEVADDYCGASTAGELIR